MIRTKRIYDAAEPDDGTRVLIDRLWPRGVSREDAALDEWLRDVAPSAELRTAWHRDPDGHDPSHFSDFAAHYRAELAEPPASNALDQLVKFARESEALTLLYGAKDEQVNHAVVLIDALRELLNSARA